MISSLVLLRSMLFWLHHPARFPPKPGRKFHCCFKSIRSCWCWVVWTAWTGRGWACSPGGLRCSAFWVKKVWRSIRSGGDTEVLSAKSDSSNPFSSLWITFIWSWSLFVFCLFFTQKCFKGQISVENMCYHSFLSGILGEYEVSVNDLTAAPENKPLKTWSLEHFVEQFQSFFGYSHLNPNQSVHTRGTQLYSQLLSLY